MKTAVLINRKGQEETRLTLLPEHNSTIVWGGRAWGFGVAKLNGEHHFYDITPENPPMGNPVDALHDPIPDNPGFRPCNCEDYPCCGH